jgi:hypothetical protein
MKDGSAKCRTEESFKAVEEYVCVEVSYRLLILPISYIATFSRWVEYGEQSVAFRIASWRDQRADEGDSRIAMATNSNFMAFVSNKAITNRTKFAQQLRQAASQTDFTDAGFLRTIFEIVDNMHSPCLRLELLQYVLGLDNRFSVAHVKRSIELAATCMSIAA